MLGQNARKQSIILSDKLPLVFLVEIQNGEIFYGFVEIYLVPKLE
jgi:hypothetical protein